MKNTGAQIVRKTLPPLLRGSSALLPGLFVFLLDQGLKDSIERQPEESFPRGIGHEDSPAEWQKMHNTGFALGKASEQPEKVRNIAAAAMVLPVVQYLRSPKGLRGSAGRLGGGLVLFGSLSNLADRFKRGYVVDFIHMKKGPLSNIVFNLGDAAILAGGILGCLAEIFRPAGKREKAGDEGSGK